MTRFPKMCSHQLTARALCKGLAAAALAGSVPAASSFEMFPVALNGGAYAKETNFELDKLAFQSEADIAACGLSKRRYANANYKPLHEAITRSAYKAVGRPIDRESWRSPKVAGAIWNDDPEYLARKAVHYDGFRKANYYIRLMDEKPKRVKDEASLTRRSHYGDLQFLHAMAPRHDGHVQSQNDTRKNLYAWTRAAYEVATGVIGESTKLADTTLNSVLPGYACTGRYSLTTESCTVLDLFDLSIFWRAEDDSICDARQRELKLTAKQCVTRDLAIGALLHTVQDSFSSSHVERDSAMVPKRFLSYPNHRHCEGDIAVEKNRPHINAALKASIKILELYSRQESWPKVEPYIATIFGISEQERIEFDKAYSR